MPDPDAASRLQFLRDVGARLWPAPASIEVFPARSRPRTDFATDYLLLAGVARPRLLVPLSSRRAAAAAVRRYGEHSGRRARLLNQALRLAVVTGAAGRLPLDHVRIARPGPGHEDIESHLSEVFGTPVLLSLHLSGARANRKPVLQVLDSRGATLGFVKVGINPLTTALVDHEAEALATLARMQRRVLVVPKVLSHHTWNDLTVLVLAPLPVDRARVPDRGQRLRALTELDAEQQTGQPLREAAWWQNLRARVDGLEDRPVGRRLAGTVRALDDRAGAVPLRFAPAHGDWTSWNTAVTRDEVLAWDWERFETSVPVGYDRLHFELQERTIGRGESRDDAARQLCRSAPELLRSVVDEPEKANVVAAVYLIDIACRYLGERQEEAGAAAGRVEDWLLPALEELLAGMSETMIGGTRADR